MKKINTIIFLFGFKSALIADVTSITEIVALSPAHSTGTRIVAQKLNGTNRVMLTVTLDGNDANSGHGDYKGNQYIEVYLGANTSASVSSFPTSAKLSVASPSVGAITAVGGSDGDNVATFYITKETIESAYGASMEGKYFDFVIAFSGASTTYLAVTPINDASKGGGGVSHYYDTDVPWFSALNYPSNNSVHISEMKVIYTPDENLSSTYSSTLRYLGDDSGSGVDNGSSHTFTLAGLTGQTTVDLENNFTSGGNLVDGAGYDLAFELYDVAGNKRTYTNVRSNVVYDGTVPTISTASSTTADGTKYIGDDIVVTLTFSEAIYTSGAMNVPFEVDDDGSPGDKTVSISSFGSDSDLSTTKNLTYTVESGHFTDDLDLKTISMASGEAKDKAGNAISNFALTGGDGAGLAASEAFKIDGVRPTVVSITSSTDANADPGYGVGKEIGITVTFSEAVTLGGGGEFTVTLNTGGTAVIDAIDNTNSATGTYTVAAGESTNALTAASVSFTGTLKDNGGAGNAMTDMSIATNLAASKTIKIETTLPTVASVTSTTNNGTYGIGQTVAVKITFSEAVTLSGDNKKVSITLETGDNDYVVEIPTISGADNASGDFLIAEGHTTSGNKLEAKSVSVTGSLKDGAGNVMADAGMAIPDGQNLDDLKDIKIDGAYPTITSATSTTNDGTYKIGDDVNIKLEFSEELWLASSTLDATLNHGNTANAKVSISTFSDKSNASATYTVAATDTTDDLDIQTLSLATGATLKDAGGNAVQNFVPAAILSTNKDIKIDGIRPTILKIRSSQPAGYYKVGDVIPIQIYFTEAVSTTAANILSATLETGSSNADAIVTYGAISNSGLATQDYTVRTNDFNTSLTVNSVAVSGGQKVNDQAGNEMTDKAIPNGKNLADEIVDIYVDGVLPVDNGTAITMTTKGGNVVADKYNDTNTSVDFVVTIVNSDATLIGGTVQMQAKIAPNGWATIGDAQTITSANVTAGKVTVNVLSAPIEALTGFATDGVIKIKATVTDKAGNSTDWAESSNTLTIDVTVPTITSATSTSNAGIYKATDDINVTLGFSEAVTMHDDVLKITLNTSASYTMAANTISNVSTKSTTYTVDIGETTPDISGASSATLAVSSVSTAAGQLRDQAGNPMVLPVTSIATKIADAKAISVDGVFPAALTADTVIATGNTVRHGYWNGVNTGVTVHIPLTKTDNTLVDGKVRIKAKKSTDGSWTYVGDWSTIISSELNAGNKVMTLTANNISAFTNQEGNIIEFTAGVQDKAGNETEWTKSSQTLFVDTVKPTEQQVTATITAVGGNVVANVWNSTNSSVSVKVDFPIDASLENGEVLLTSSQDGSSYSDFGDTTKITSGIYSAKTVTISVDSVISGSKVGLEELAWFTEGDILRFRAKVLDRAGNERHYTVSATTLTVKQELPTVASVTSTNDNKAYKAGQDLTIQVIGSEVLNVSGTPKLKLETGNTDALISYASGSTTNTLAFTYSIVSPHTSDDLNYFATDALSISGSDYIRDNYGNPLILTLPVLDNNNALIKKKDIVIDTTPPSVRFTYDDPDSLVRKETGTLIITATFSDSIMVDSIPRISVDFPAKGTITTAGVNGTATTGDKTSQNMTRKSGKVYTYNLPIVDDSDGIIKVTVDAKDKALNTIIADSTFDGNIVTIDNTDPVAFTTGLVTLFGDTVAGSWFNKTTDSLKANVPIDITDNSLLRGNIQIQMQVDGKMASDAWTTILPKDTLEALSATAPKYRTKKEVLDILTPKNLAQGDSVFIRALLNDQVGNITEGLKSTSFFILDTIPPAVGVVVDLAHIPDTTLNNLKGVSTFLTTLRDTLWTSDTLGFGVRNWTDPKLEAEVGVSGIQRYEYQILQSPDNDASKTFSLFRDYQFQVDTLDTVMIAIDSLRHNRHYKMNIRAYDVAGNVSAAIVTNPVLRYNARPIGEAIADVVVKEDILWEKRWKVTDKDLSVRDSDDKHIGGTLLSDKFTFALTTMKIDTTKNPIDSTVVTVDGKAAVNTSGEVSFTPTKLDTAKYVFRVIVTDQWTLKDTVDINIRAIPVNDAPILNLDPIINTWAGKKLTFLEGDSSEHINLTRYAYDEDNDTTSLKYAFRIASTIPANIGYPIAKLGFLSDFGSEYKKSFINKLIDEFPASTIVQKNNSFLIYSGNIDEFKDPIKVDSLRTTDSLFTWIMPTDTTSLDTNYYTESEMLVEFSVIDPEGLIGKDTVTFVINPINDKPVWTGVRDTVVKENDSLLIDFANYLYDVDDSTLTITIEPKTFANNVTLDSSKMSAEAAKTFIPTKTSYQFQSQAHKDTVKIKPQPLWFDYENGKPRKGLWNPLDTLSNQIKFVITAADDEGASATDSFIVKVQRVPRPEIRMYVVQNNAFTNYYEVFLVDSLGKTKDITLEVQSTAVTLDTAAAYTYVGHYNFPTKGNYIFEAKVTGEVGDTSITNTLGLTLAKMYGRWSGKSVDGQFQVIGQNGSVDFDQSIMILDSTLFEPYFNDRASYLLGNEAYRFKKSVEISLPGEQETAIYSRSIGSGWVELPSINEGSRVLAYTEKMGYFRIGPKTLIVPGQTSLQQNYPNPFNPATTIEYDLGFVDGPYQKVNITVYDILGRKIKLLVNEEQSIGRYQVRWDGKDQNGVPVSSGIYFVNLLTDMGRSKTKKVMLMR